MRHKLTNELMQRPRSISADNKDAGRIYDEMREAILKALKK